MLRRKTYTDFIFPPYLVPSEAPPGVQCNHNSSTSLRIEWSILPVVKAHGIVRTYVIFLERSDGRHVELYNDIQPYTSFTTIFLGLDENVEYSVQTLATTVKGEGPKSDPITCVTEEDGKCGSVGVVSVCVVHLCDQGSIPVICSCLITLPYT